MDGEAHNHEVVEEDTSDPTRFVDDWKTSLWFSNQGKLFACKCGALLRVANGEDGARVCTRACGAKQGGEELRLFLRRRVAGIEFFAFNRAHLEYMARIVKATQRVGTPCNGGCPICGCSIMRKLPKEILSASNRDKVLRAIDAMTAELNAAEKQL